MDYHPNSTPRIKTPILVTGAHRTGTTWVGKMLAASGETAYVSEPLNVLHRPGVLRAQVKYWYAYLCIRNEAEYLPALNDTIRLHYHPGLEMLSLRSTKDVLRMCRDWNVFLRGRLLSQRALLKDPFAVFSAPWFARRLGCQVVITVRHPAAFASSLKRLDWPFDFNNLLAQPLLMQDWLEPYRSEMEKLVQTPADIIEQGSWLWRIVYQVVAEYRREFPDFQVVRHEDLSKDPLPGFGALYNCLGLQFGSQAQKSIRESSSSDNPKELSSQTVHSVRLDSQANLYSWKRRLAEDEIRRIRRITEEVAVLYYPDQDWE
jgi:hypothetical protein